MKKSQNKKEKHLLKSRLIVINKQKSKNDGEDGKGDITHKLLL